MNRKVSYYTSRKSALVWLAVAALVCSVILRIAYSCGKGADAATVWLQIVLPVFACLSYALILLTDAQERLYRTAMPVALMAVFYCARIASVGLGRRYVLLCWIAYAAFAAVYLFIISGYVAHAWFLAMMYLAALCIGLHDCWGMFRAQMPQTLALLPDLLPLLAGLLVVFSMKIHLDNAYHPTWGDRPDGRRLRTLDPIQVVGNYIMPNRVPASNFVRDTVEISNMEKYIREKRRQGLTSFGITHVFLSAYVRCVARYPAVNRFISGQQVYSRDGDIQFCMTIKEEMTTTGGESCIKLHLRPDDTPEDVYRKMNEEVAKVKNPTGTSDFDKTAKLLSFIPGILFKFTVWLLKTMDYFGLIPRFLLEVSPFHGSVYFTSMGSLGIQPVVHHLYDFGNLPVFCAFGCKYRRNELEADGTVVQKKYVDYTVNTDERICDGFYFATVLKYLKRLLAHPERLDVPPEEVVRDID